MAEEWHRCGRCGARYRSARAAGLCCSSPASDDDSGGPAVAIADGGASAVDEYRSRAAEIYAEMAADLSSLQRHWDKVIDDSRTCGSRSGGWDVRKEHEGDRLGPPFHEVAIYVESCSRIQEVARWSLDGDLPDDPTETVRLEVAPETYDGGRDDDRREHAECPNCGGADEQTDDDGSRICWKCGTRWSA